MKMRRRQKPPALIDQEQPLRRIHTQDERYAERHEIFSLSTPRGQRTYVHRQPYILEPDIRLTLALTPQTHPQGAIGRELGAEQRTWRWREIGQAQEWHYPADKTPVVWECYLYDWLRTDDDPARDPAHVALWHGFERWLVGHLPPVERIATTWEDLCERPTWQQFLERQGYRPYRAAAPAAFVKALPHRYGAHSPACPPITTRDLRTGR